jgi:hypothetical protein
LPSADARIRWYRAVVEWARPAFEAAYNDEEVPGGEACLRVAQALPDEGNGATSNTTALQYHVPAEERREPHAAESDRRVR